MTKPELLLPFFRHIPDHLRGQAFIAGGAVLDIRKASDIDIFVIRSGRETGHLEEIKGWIGRNRLVNWSEEESSDKMAIVFYDEYGKKINIICDESNTIEDLLADFDISTSRWAIDPNGRRIRGKMATAPGKPIIVFYLSKTTTARVEKYCRRFGTGYSRRRV